MPRTCRAQALLSTRRALRTRKNRRNANVAERASHASPFPVGGGLGADLEEPEPEVVYPLIGTRSPTVVEENWDKARSQVAAYLGTETTSSSEESFHDVEEEDVAIEVELQRYSKLKAAVLAASNQKELEEVKAAMQPGSHWRSAAPWIRRGPTLPQRRREEERKPQVDWVSQAGLKPHVLAAKQAQAPKASASRQVQALPDLRPRRALAPAAPAAPAPDPEEGDLEDIDDSDGRHVPSAATLRALRRELHRAPRFFSALPPLRPLVLPTLESETLPVARTRQHLPTLPPRLL